MSHHGKPQSRLRRIALRTLALIALGLTGWMILTVKMPERGAPPVAASSSVFQTGCVPAPAGLVGWWPFDGTSNDFQVTNNVTLFGSPAFVSGKVAQALQFDGVNDVGELVLPSSSMNVGTGNGFTIEMWINPADVSTERPLVEWGDGNSIGAHFWIAVPSAGGGLGSLYANIKDTAGGDHIISSSGPPVLTAGQYQHVALVYLKSASAALLYVNGNVVVEDNFGFVFTPDTRFNLFIGARVLGGISSPLFSGEMDEIGIYSRALSTAEIQTINNAGSVGKCKTRYVTNTDDSGVGSLRQTIIDSDNYRTPNTIAFNIPSGVKTINPQSALPNITGPVTIDGTTQPGYAGAPLIELNGASAGSAFGLDCRAPVTIKGLVINRFGGGIQLGVEAGGSTVAGNYIGTDSTGTLDFGNSENGIRIAAGANNNIIGGTTPGARNVISGNGGAGVLVLSSGNMVQGNYIGTDVTGAQAIGNVGEGIRILDGSNNQIGGTTAAARNVLSGNFQQGVEIYGSSAIGNTIQGNYIGTDVTGNVALRNRLEGVFVRSAASNNIIGGTATGAGNVIANNGLEGVNVEGSDSIRIAIQGNSIFANGTLFGSLGIALSAPNGVTPNDPLDGDAGANNLQNFPVLTSAISSGGNTTIQGMLNSTPFQSFRIELFANSACDPSGNGEGQTFLGSTNVSQTDNMGNGSFSLTVPTNSITGPYLTATATDLNGNTSEFSQCLAITNTCPTITVNPTSLPNGFVSVGYPSQTFTASGGTPPYSYAVSAGSLPAGLNLVGDTLSGTPTAAGIFNFTITATDNMSCQGSRAYTVTINNSGTGATNLQFYPLAHPIRLLDTRVNATACDAPGMMIQGQTSRTQTAAGGACDGLTIPANAKALTGNITTVESGGGFLTLYPSDTQRPLVANSNFASNQVLNNVFTVGLGTGDGAFNIFVTTNTNVVVDITGYYAPPAVGGLYFHPLPHPVRLMDTRTGATACFTPGAPLQAGSTMTQLATTTCDSVMVPAGGLALVGSATTVNSQANGFLTLFPSDAARPLAASSNFKAGINMNAPFTVGLSPSGHFNIYTAATTDLVIDVLGYYSTQLNDANGHGLLFNTLPAPVRLLDTRVNQSACFTPGAQMIGGTPYMQSATGACTGIPAAAKAVVGNATVVNSSANGFLTFWPSSALQPTVATSNYQMGQAFNRHFTVGLGADGAFNRFSSRTTDLVIDLSGYFAP